MVEKALRGEQVEFTYKGVVFRVVPETRKSKLANLVGQPTLATNVDSTALSKQLVAEMEAEWQHDWSTL
jgi:hypothetical protein